MLFFVRFDVTQPANVSNQQLVETWIREAEAAVGAMDAGAVPHLWKVAGQRVVLGVVDAPSAEDLDRALGGLPIIREMGPGVTTEALPIYDYRTFAKDLTDGAYGG
jgi:muconolactone delta-isomerase